MGFPTACYMFFSFCCFFCSEPVHLCAFGSYVGVGGVSCWMFRSLWLQVRMLELFVRVSCCLDMSLIIYAFCFLFFVCCAPFCSILEVVLLVSLVLLGCGGLDVVFSCFFFFEVFVFVLFCAFLCGFVMVLCGCGRCLNPGCL